MKPVYVSLLIVLGFAVPAFAQPAYEITESEPAQYNGLEYGFSVRNESKKDVGSKGSFSRYELTVYVTNKSGCTKLFFPRQTPFGPRDQDLLAQFDCVNATGARLTAKNATVRARPFSVPYSTTSKNAQGKDVTTTVQVAAGHLLDNGETVSQNLIVLVPDGEQPRVKVRVQTVEVANRN